MSRNPKVSQMTAAVLMAQKKYPEVLAAVIAKLNSPAPYMKEKIDSRTRDKQLLQMTPDDMANLARTDPVAAEQAAQRITQLQARDAAVPLAPAQDEFEEE